MKAVAVLEPGKVGIVDIPMPVCGDYDCLVKVKASGICSSTDMKIVKNTHPETAFHRFTYPCILGHESAGEIIEVGKKVRHMKVGDHVVSPSGARQIPECGYSFSYGAMCEYSIAFDAQAAKEDGYDRGDRWSSLPLEDVGCKVIPSDIPFADATMILGFKENYSALRNFGVKEGMDILLYGDGPNGKGLALFMEAYKVNSLVIVGHHDDRLASVAKVAKGSKLINSAKVNVEEELAGRKFDLVIDAVGSVDIIRQGAKMLKPGGKVCVFGVLNKDKSTLDLYDIPNFTGVQILSYPYKEHRELDKILELIKSGYIDVSEFISHKIPFDQAAEGVRMLETREAFKVILTLD